MTSQTVHKRNGDRICGFILIILLTVSTVCLYLAGCELYQYEKARAAYERMDQELISQIPEAQENEDLSDESEAEPEEIWWPQLDIDFDGYREINEDFVGILYFPLFDPRYPVAISQNNTEYLTQTFEKEQNASGCIFMDYQNRKNFKDRNTYLYGHNMRDGSMFGSLKRLIREPELCEGEPKIYVYTSDYIYEYQLHVVELAPADERIRGIYTDRQYDEYMEKIIVRASFTNTELDLTARPDILTLYTCWGTDYRYKLLVHGLQTRVKELHPQKLYPPKEKIRYG